MSHKPHLDYKWGTIDGGGSVWNDQVATPLKHLDVLFLRDDCLISNAAFKRKKHTIPQGDPYISLFADASFCPLTRAYGWCYWIKHGTPAQTIIRAGGGLRIRSSQEAEIEALRQGLREIYGLDFNGKRIVVQSDCLGALFQIRSELDAIKNAGATSAHTQHVKGHQGRRNAASAINTQCDRRAGREMRQFREEKLRLSEQDMKANQRCRGDMGVSADTSR